MDDGPSPTTTRARFTPRKLRIPLAAIFTLASLLLIALWIRTHHRVTLWERNTSNTQSIVLGAAKGRILYLKAPVTLATTWNALLDANVDSRLQQDAAMVSLQAQLSYAKTKPLLNRGGVRADLQLEHEITKIELQIQQYRDAMRLQTAEESLDYLAPPPSPADSTWSKAIYRLGFASMPFPSGRAIIIPFWFPVAITATLATLLGIRTRPRFSLRTLFIALTVIAIVLGYLAATTLKQN